MNDEGLVSIGVLDVSPGETTEMSFLSEETNAFENSVLFLTNVVPACAKGFVTTKPFLLQIVESNRVHVATKFIAKTAGGNEIFDADTVVTSRNDMFTSRCIAWDNGKVGEVDFFHAMATVATSVILGFRKYMNTSHK